MVWRARIPGRLVALLLFCALSLEVLALPAQAEELQLLLLATAGLRGLIYPLNYERGEPSPGGLARVATEIRRRQAGGQLLLLDGGDALGEEGSAVLRAMKELGYAALAVGDEELDRSSENLEELRSAASFPFLAANVVNRRGEPRFQPYLIQDYGSFQVGVLGLLTPQAENWLAPGRLLGLRILDPVETARSYVPLLREKGADVVVVLAHTAWPGEEPLPPPRREERLWLRQEEGFLARLATEVAGIEVVVVVGHRARGTPRPDCGERGEPGEEKGVEVPAGEGPLLLRPGAEGSALGEVRLTLRRDGAEGPWRVVAREAHLVPLAGVEPDPAVLAWGQSEHERRQAFYQAPAGALEGPLPPEGLARTQAFLNLLNQVQLWVSGADLSVASLPAGSVPLPVGPLTRQDVYRFYPYPDLLYKVIVTGAQLRAALERSALCLAPYAGQKRAEELIDPAVSPAQWDVYAGLEYTLDLTRPPGQRVVSLKYKGQEVDPNEILTLALSGWRARGGDGYGM
ncbi:MAG: 5'-nucleotidase C-terminal domain-containing protein, partial [Bacillota bacterium]|nr:5'-nucleotidase C-terminal domain-containing protein [Bacillota bacterium]